MADKKFTANENIIITVERKLNTDSVTSSHPKKKPTNVKRRRKTYEARRQLGNYVNFYDLGFLVEGLDTRDSGIAYGYNPVTSGGNTLRDFYNFPLSIDIELWSETFVKITKSRPYKFNVLLYDDDTQINTTSQLLDTNNPKWTESGYQVSNKFNGFGINDPNYLMELFESTSNNTSLRVTEEGTSTANGIVMPKLDPLLGAINIYLSPAVVRMGTTQPLAPPTGSGYISPVETAYPEGYNLITPACPALTSPGVPTDWEVAIVSTSAFSDSGNQLSANSVSLTALNRIAAFADPLDASNSEVDPSDKLEYIARTMVLNYFGTAYVRAGSYYNATPKASGVFPASYIGRNYLCHGGNSIPVSNGIAANRANYTVDTRNTTATAAFAFTDDFPANVDQPYTTIPSSTPTGVGGALLAAINQKDKWYFIWHVHRHYDS